ncbi:hypothetical protein EAG21025_20990 [Enterobacter asburiae]
MSDTKQRTNAYPQPPFPEQPQTPPGLASEMQPVPDHGKKATKDMAALPAKKRSLPAETPVLVARSLSPMLVKALTLPLTTCPKRKKTPLRSST